MTIVRPYLLIYDGMCRLCTAATDLARRLDQYNLVEMIPAHEVDLASLPAPVSRDDLLREIHLLSPAGELFRGADAVAVLSGLLPRTRLVGAFLRLPLIRNLARPLYRAIARRRTSILGRIRPSNPQ